MNRRVLQGFLFFTGTLCLLVSILWKPLQNITHQRRRIQELKTLYQSLQSKEAIQSVHTALHQYLVEIQQKEFLTAFDEKECLDLLTRLAKQNYVTLKQFHFGDPFEDSIQGDQPIPLFVSYTPITIELQALSEPALRQMIETFNQIAKGLIFPRHLTITYTKTHEFLATYEFFGIRGK